MKKKTIKNYRYGGLGFPIILPSVEMVFFEDEWHPKIDVYDTANKAIQALITQESRFTGNQIKFIRTYFAMTLRTFAKEVVHESHAAVNKWENLGDNATNMDGNIEAMLRLYIYEKILEKNLKQKNNFYQKYQEIKKLFLADKNQVTHLKLAA